MFPDMGALPTIPSPNNTSNFPSSASSSQYTLAVELTDVVSFASVYEYKFETVADVCILTTNPLVSVFAFGSVNFWSGSTVFAVYL